MPITLPNIITQPQLVADMIWISTVNIIAPNGPGQPVTANISVCPMVSSTGQLFLDQTQNIYLTNVLSSAAVNPFINNAMTTIFAAVEELCGEKNLLGFTSSLSQSQYAF